MTCKTISPPKKQTRIFVAIALLIFGLSKAFSAENCVNDFPPENQIYSEVCLDDLKLDLSSTVENENVSNCSLFENIRFDKRSIKNAPINFSRLEHNPQEAYNFELQDGRKLSEVINFITLAFKKLPAEVQNLICITPGLKLAHEGQTGTVLENIGFDGQEKKKSPGVIFIRYKGIMSGKPWQENYAAYEHSFFGREIVNGKVAENSALIPPNLPRFYLSSESYSPHELGFIYVLLHEFGHVLFPQEGWVPDIDSMSEYQKTLIELRKIPENYFGYDIYDWNPNPGTLRVLRENAESIYRRLFSSNIFLTIYSTHFSPERLAEYTAIHLLSEIQQISVGYAKSDGTEDFDLKQKYTSNKFELIRQMVNSQIKFFIENSGFVLK